MNHSGVPAPGVCSVTFRGRPAAEVADLAASAGLSCIEWGGDVHVPHGDLAAARQALRLTTKAGLFVASYGSYLFADDGATGSTAAVLDTAEALGAPAVRVWAPFGVEPGATPVALGAVARALAGITTAARSRGLWVYLEFHGGTLTATAASAMELVAAVDAPNLLCGWQPPYWQGSVDGHGIRDEPADREDLELLAPVLGHLHVYSWLGDATRLALGEHHDAWARRLETTVGIIEPDGFRRAALLEFVAGDDPGAFATDAALLRKLLARVAAQPVPYPGGEEQK